MDESAVKTKVGVAAFDGSQEREYGYSVPDAQSGEELGTIYYRNIGQKKIDEYRLIRNGDGGRRKGHEGKAREFLFRLAYLRFEFTEPGKELDLGDFVAKNPIEQREKEISFFLVNALKVVDATIIRYLNEVFPDIDEKK
jgi:hypothetical protein